MAADAGIFQQYLKPVRSMADYQGDMDKQEQNALTLAAARQTAADDNAVRQAYMQSGGDTNKIRQALLQGGNVKALNAYDKTQLETQKTQGDIGLTKAKTTHTIQQTDAGSYKMQVEKHDKAITDIAALQDPQTAHSSIDAHLASGDIDPAKAQALHASIPQDPSQFSSWQVNMLRGILTAKDQLGQVSPDANARLSSQTSLATNAATNATSRANNSASVGATMRGQNMTDGRARETLGQGKIPAGYRAMPDGNLQAIPGGPADLKLQGAFNQDTAALTGSTSAMDRLATAANEALNHPGLAGTAGLRGMVPNVPGTSAADAAALLNTLKSQVAFGVLQDMRNNSKTGGALGSVSDAEGKRLEANLAALEKSQSVEQLKASLKKIVDYTDQAKDRLRGAYNLKHAGSNPAPQAAPAGAKPSLTDIFGK